MKRVLIFLLLLTNIGIAQTSVDYNLIIPPGYVSPESIEERLVQIAWQNYPENDAVERNIEIAKQNLVQARWSWLDNLSVAGNLNEFNINPNATDGNFFLPRYNFGVRVGLGMFVNAPSQTKQAKEGLEIAKDNYNQQKLHLRAEVLRRYNIYTLNKELFSIQNENFEDASSLFALTEENFKDGKISFNDFSKSRDAYNAERIKKIRAENEYLISKINLEELLGIPLENILY